MTVDSGPVFPGYSRKEDPWGESPSGNFGDTFYDGQPTPGPTPEQLKVLDAFAKDEITREDAERLLDECAEPGA